jgi:hypothetical protein
MVYDDETYAARDLCQNILKLIEQEKPDVQLTALAVCTLSIYLAVSKTPSIPEFFKFMGDVAHIYMEELQNEAASAASPLQ